MVYMFVPFSKDVDANICMFCAVLQGQNLLSDQLLLGGSLGQQNDSNLSAGSSRQSDEHPACTLPTQDVQVSQLSTYSGTTHMMCSVLIYSTRHNKRAPPP